MAFDAKGRLLATHVPWGQTKVSVIYPKGSERVLVDNFEGKPFGRANDLFPSRRMFSPPATAL